MALLWNCSNRSAFRKKMGYTLKCNLWCRELAWLPWFIGCLGAVMDKRFNCQSCLSCWHWTLGGLGNSRIFCYCCTFCTNSSIYMHSILQWMERCSKTQWLNSETSKIGRKHSTLPYSALIWMAHQNNRRNTQLLLANHKARTQDGTIQFVIHQTNVQISTNNVILIQVQQWEYWKQWPQGQRAKQIQLNCGNIIENNFNSSAE